MNYKLLFPTYRTRLRYVEDALGRITAGGSIERMLNLGCGEGDIDRTLKSFCGELHSCDLNAADVEHARSLNADVPSIVYAVENGEQLSYPNGHFNIVCCLEVIEHVPNPKRLIAEIKRVLVPGGHAIVTCPSDLWPLTYDPINAALRLLGTKLPFGAFGYGHDHLIREEDAEQWFSAAGLRVTEKRRLSKALASAVEAYWPGALQRVFKANAANAGGGGASRAPKLRPAVGDPPGLGLTDALISLDDRLFSSARRSVGLAFVVEKPA